MEVLESLSFSIVFAKMECGAILPIQIFSSLKRIAAVVICLACPL